MRWPRFGIYAVWIQANVALLFALALGTAAHPFLERARDFFFVGLFSQYRGRAPAKRWLFDTRPADTKGRPAGHIYLSIAGVVRASGWDSKRLRVGVYPNLPARCLAPRRAVAATIYDSPKQPSTSTSTATSTATSTSTSTPT